MSWIYTHKMGKSPAQIEFLFYFFFIQIFDANVLCGSLVDVDYVLSMNGFLSEFSFFSSSFMSQIIFISIIYRFVSYLDSFDLFRFFDFFEKLEFLHLVFIWNSFIFAVRLVKPKREKRVKIRKREIYIR